MNCLLAFENYLLVKCILVVDLCTNQTLPMNTQNYGVTLNKTLDYIIVIQEFPHETWNMHCYAIFVLWYSVRDFFYKLMILQQVMFIWCNNISTNILSVTQIYFTCLVNAHFQVSRQFSYASKHFICNIVNYL